MRHEQKLLGYYNYTVVLTYIGMLFGFVGIISSFEGEALKAVICLMVSGFCDMFDGAIASTMKRTDSEKCFGIQIDSLSDLICFGVLPGCIAYNLAGKNFFSIAVSGLYVLCALIRLAYFNVDEQERQKHSSGSREVYFGLPVTMSALFIPFVYGIVNVFSVKTYVSFLLTLLTMALLFLLPIPLKKPKVVGKICVALCGLMEVVLVSFSCLGV